VWISVPLFFFILCLSSLLRPFLSFVPVGASIDARAVLTPAYTSSARVGFLSIYPSMTEFSIQPSHFDRIAECFETGVPKMEFDDRTGFVGCADYSAPPAGHWHDARHGPHPGDRH
jgi:hypothetical protein